MRRILTLVIVLALMFGLIMPTVSYSANSITPQNIYLDSSDGRGAIVTNTDELWIWGLANDEYGLLKTPLKVLDGVKMVSCDYNFMAAVKNDGSLWVCGEGGSWLLSDWSHNTNNYPLKLTKIMNSGVKSVCVSSTNVAIIKDDNSLWMWGRNDHSEIGNGYNGNKYQTNFAGDLVPIQTIPIKILDDVVQVSLGVGFSVALKSDGSVWTWGWNQSGQLGNGGKGNVDAIATHFLESGKVQTVPMKIMDDVSSISAGQSHAAAIKNDGSLWMWGFVKTKADDKKHDTPIKIMDDVVQVSTGRWCSAVVKNDGSLWTWGEANELGQCGNGSISDSYVTPTKIMDNVNSVSIELGSTVIVKNDGSVWTCGSILYCGNGGKYDMIDEFGNEIQTVPLKIMDGAKLAETGASVVPQPPTDVPSDWAKPIMEKAVNSGLVPETLQSNWQKPISREETAALAVRYLEAATKKPIQEILAENGASVNQDAFTDTNDSNVLYVNALDIVTGFGDNKFKPKDTLTRAQAAVIICNVARTCGIDTEGYSSEFSDTIGHWANKFIGWPAHKGIVAGVGNNKFNPDGTLTKEQAIAIFYSMFIML